MSADSDPPSEGASLRVATGSALLRHETGLHARPAVKLTKLAKRFQSQISVRVTNAAEWINAKSIAKVMGMRAPRDAMIEFKATGMDAEAAVAALVELVAGDFQDAER
jgi:phosphocarrier protein HPr